MNATTNTPHPPCPDAVVVEAEVEAEAVVCPIPLSLIPSPLPLGDPWRQSMTALHLSTRHLCLPHHYRQRPTAC
jgi:hypothetical protein